MQVPTALNCMAEKKRALRKEQFLAMHSSAFSSNLIVGCKRKFNANILGTKKQKNSCLYKSAIEKLERKPFIFIFKTGLTNAL